MNNLRNLQIRICLSSSSLTYAFLFVFKFCERQKERSFDYDLHVEKVSNFYTSTYIYICTWSCILPRNKLDERNDAAWYDDTDRGCKQTVPIRPWQCFIVLLNNRCLIFPINKTEVLKDGQMVVTSRTNRIYASSIIGASRRLNGSIFKRVVKYRRVRVREHSAVFDTF